VALLVAGVVGGADPAGVLVPGAIDAVGPALLSGTVGATEVPLVAVGAGPARNARVQPATAAAVRAIPAAISVRREGFGTASA
jgi:hypothetical protein